MKERTNKIKIMCILEGVLMGILSFMMVFLSTYTVTKSRVIKLVEGDFYKNSIINKSNIDVSLIINSNKEVMLLNIFTILMIIIVFAVIVFLLIISISNKKYSIIDKMKNLCWKTSIASVMSLIYGIGALYAEDIGDILLEMKQIDISLFNEYTYKMIAVFIVFLAVSIGTEVFIIMKNKRIKKSAV